VLAASLSAPPPTGRNTAIGSWNEIVRDAFPGFTTTIPCW
jgi:hypothetical protein